MALAISHIYITKIYYCQIFLLTGNVAVTDPVSSLLPHHEIIEQAIIEAEKRSQERWAYRNEDESSLAIKSLFDDK